MGLAGQPCSQNPITVEGENRFGDQIGDEGDCGVDGGLFFWTGMRIAVQESLGC